MVVFVTVPSSFYADFICAQASQGRLHGSVPLLNRFCSSFNFNFKSNSFIRFWGPIQGTVHTRTAMELGTHAIEKSPDAKSNQLPSDKLLSNGHKPIVNSLYDDDDDFDVNTETRFLTALPAHDVTATKSTVDHDTEDGEIVENSCDASTFNDRKRTRSPSRQSKQNDKSSKTGKSRSTKSHNHSPERQQRRARSRSKRKRSKSRGEHDKRERMKDDMPKQRDTQHRNERWTKRYRGYARFRGNFVRRKSNFFNNFCRDGGFRRNSRNRKFQGNDRFNRRQPSPRNSIAPSSKNVKYTKCTPSLSYADNGRYSPKAATNNQPARSETNATVSPSDSKPDTNGKESRKVESKKEEKLPSQSRQRSRSKSKSLIPKQTKHRSDSKNSKSEEAFENGTPKDGNEHHRVSRRSASKQREQTECETTREDVVNVSVTTLPDVIQPVLPTIPLNLNISKQKPHFENRPEEKQVEEPIPSMPMDEHEKQEHASKRSKSTDDSGKVSKSGKSAKRKAEPSIALFYDEYDEFMLCVGPSLGDNNETNEKTNELRSTTPPLDANHRIGALGASTLPDSELKPVSPPSTIPISPKCEKVNSSFNEEAPKGQSASEADVDHNSTDDRPIDGLHESPVQPTPNVESKPEYSPTNRMKPEFMNVSIEEKEETNAESDNESVSSFSSSTSTTSSTSSDSSSTTSSTSSSSSSSSSTSTSSSDSSTSDEESGSSSNSALDEKNVSVRMNISDTPPPTNKCDLSVAEEATTPERKHFEDSATKALRSLGINLDEELLSDTSDLLQKVESYKQCMEKRRAKQQGAAKSNEGNAYADNNNSVDEQTTINDPNRTSVLLKLNKQPVASGGNIFDSDIDGGQHKHRSKSKSSGIVSAKGTETSEDSKRSTHGDGKKSRGDDERSKRRSADRHRRRSDEDRKKSSSRRSTKSSRRRSRSPHSSKYTSSRSRRNSRERHGSSERSSKRVRSRSSRFGRSVRQSFSPPARSSRRSTSRNRSMASPIETRRRSLSPDRHYRQASPSWYRYERRSPPICNCSPNRCICMDRNGLPRNLVAVSRGPRTPPNTPPGSNRHGQTPPDIMRHRQTPPSPPLLYAYTGMPMGSATPLYQESPMMALPPMPMDADYASVYNHSPQYPPPMNNAHMPVLGSGDGYYYQTLIPPHAMAPPIDQQHPILPHNRPYPSYTNQSSFGNSPMNAIQNTKPPPMRKLEHKSTIVQKGNVLEIVPGAEMQQETSNVATSDSTPVDPTPKVEASPMTDEQILRMERLKRKKERQKRRLAKEKRKEFVISEIKRLSQQVIVGEDGKMIRAGELLKTAAFTKYVNGSPKSDAPGTESNDTTGEPQQAQRYDYDAKAEAGKSIIVKVAAVERLVNYPRLGDNGQ